MPPVPKSPPRRHGPLLAWSLACALLALPAHAQVVVTPLTPATPAPVAPEPPAVPFAERAITLENGIAGRALSFSSANPRHYEDIVRRQPMQPVQLHAKLFVPPGSLKAPAVILTPGPGGVHPWMLLHARALTDSGIAVLLPDPLGGRGVNDTTAAPSAVSFAAATWDVFAAIRALELQPDIDATRLGAMGYGRSGVAVLQAAIRPLAEAALGSGKALRAVVAGWPWCGYQFADPQTAPTAVRFSVADTDLWASPLQCQAYFNAMKPHNGAVTRRLFKDASHGFGEGTPLREIPQAVHALNAPIVHFDARGVALNPWSDDPMPGADDRALESMMQPFVGRGATVGTQGTQMQDFLRDAVGFFITHLKL